MVPLTNHAEVRCQQRGFSERHLELVLDYGTRINNGGAIFCFMADKDIPCHISPVMREKVKGITLILDLNESEIITAYRNRGALHDIKRKRKGYRTGGPRDLSVQWRSHE